MRADLSISRAGDQYQPLLLFTPNSYLHFCNQPLSCLPLSLYRCPINRTLSPPFSICAPKGRNCTLIIHTRMLPFDFSSHRRQIGFSSSALTTCWFHSHFNLYFLAAPLPMMSINPFSCIWRASRYALVFLMFRSSCRSSSVISPYSAR